MKRRSFLRGVPVLGALLIKLPTATASRDYNLKFKDIFYNTEVPNGNLFFLKEGLFKEDFIKRLSDLGMLKEKEDHFDLPYYTGCHGVVLPIKDDYTKIELDAFVDQCLNACSKFSYLIHTHRQHFIMFFRDTRHNHLRLEVFAVFKKIS